MMNEKNTRPAWEPAVKTITVLVTLALIFLVGKSVVGNYVSFVGGKPVLLTGDTLDYRDTAITVEEYENLKDFFQGKQILWSVPLGEDYYESTSEYIILNRLNREDIGKFAYFQNLKTVDAMDCSDHEALAALEDAYPKVEVNWAVHMGGKAWSRQEPRMDLRDLNVTAAELLENLKYFLPGTAIVLGDNLTQQERQEIMAAYPDHQFSWNVELMGRIYSSDEKKLDYAGQKVDAAALIAAADQFRNMEEIDLLRSGLTVSQLAAVHDAYPNALIRCELTVYGKKLTSDMAEINLSGIKMQSTQEIEDAVKLMPNLKKVIMSDCGFSNEEMDALNKRHPDVLFVWTVHFSVYSLRTDSIGFCASDLPSRGYIAPRLSNKDLEPLKYCTELVALDLGHMNYDNLSFLQDMHKLEYLILVDARYEDISVLSQMKNLKYLELFKNDLKDLTPLLECTNLKHLNIGYTDGFDASVLKKMTWLERLWFPGHGLSEQEKQEIINSLSGVEVYMPNWDADGSTGGGWREADIYFEMRNLFGMFYQPGGTGMNN